LIGCVEIRVKGYPLPHLFLYAGFVAVKEAKDLRVRGGGMPALEKMRPFVGLGEMAWAALDRRRRSLGQGDEVHGSAPHRMRGGWWFDQ
jgi:hypothetical protein